MNRRGFFELIGKGATVLGLSKLPLAPKTPAAAVPEVVAEAIGPEVPAIATQAWPVLYGMSTGAVGSTGPTRMTGPMEPMRPFPSTPQMDLECEECGWMIDECECVDDFDEDDF